MLVLRERDRVVSRRLRCAARRAEPSNSRRIGKQHPVNISCTGSSVRASSSGDCSLTNGRFASIEERGAADRSSRWPRRPPALPRGRSKMSAALARCSRARPSAARAAARRQQAPHQRLAVDVALTIAPLLRMSVRGAGRLLEDRPGELVAPAGRNRHLDASVDRRVQWPRSLLRESGRGCRGRYRRDQER